MTEKKYFKIVRDGYNRIAERYYRDRDIFVHGKELARFVSVLPRGSSLLDIGCGGGIPVGRYLIDHGFKLTGIDFSRRSIQYAKEVAARDGLSIHYVNQDYLQFETDTCFHLILMIMCDFCALSPAQRKKMLDKFHSILEPGGSVLLDVYSLTAFQQREETAMYEADLLNGFWSPDRCYGFLNTFKYETEKVTLDKYTIIEAGRTRTIYNWLQHFSPESLEKEFSECGFAVEELCSDVAGTPFDPETGEFAVIARKR